MNERMERLDLCKHRQGLRRCWYKVAGTLTQNAGYFHGFSQNHGIDDNGAGCPYPCALVEDDISADVLVLSADYVTFKKPQDSIDHLRP